MNKEKNNSPSGRPSLDEKLAPFASALAAKAIIFDVDHTITKAATGVRLARVGFKSKEISIWTLLRFPLYFLRYRLGNYTVDNLPKVLGPLIGIPKKTLYHWGVLAFDSHIEDDIYREARELVDRLVDQGKHVILCTSSLDFAVRPLADFLRVRDVLATEVEFDANDVCNGTIKGLPAFGEGKVHKMREFLQNIGLDFGDAAFFSDSINDLPLLGKVAFPVPTNPDRRLSAHSKKSGWPTITFED